MTKSKTTPAATKTLDAIATRILSGRVAQTIRIIMVTIRDWQKPNIMPDRRNLWPRRLLTWRMVIWLAAPIM